MHVGVYLLLHVVVLVLQLCRHRSVAVLVVHAPHAVLDEVLAVLKTLAVVVAYDVMERSVLYVCLYAQKVVEALISLCGLRSLVLRQHRRELRRQPVGVHHLVLRIARVHAYALYVYLSRRGVEVLILQVSEVSAVHGVCPFASEFLHIEVVGAHSDFLIRVESHTDVTVLYLVMVAQPAHGLHYLGYSRLVVSPQQGVAVGHDDVLALMLKQFREFSR